jgi:molybdopterin converting factor small subunit
VPTINVEVLSSLTRLFVTDGHADQVRWQEDVALGETLGRLLARLVYEKPQFQQIYDPDSRRVTREVEVRVNGRIHELIGGLTYTLNNGDTITILPGNPDHGGGSRNV